MSGRNRGVAMQSIAITLSLAIALLSTQVGYAQKHHCTDVDGRRALDEAAMLRSWDALYKSFRLYHHCDDGAIGEGYSESVARILVDQWNTLPRFAHLAVKDAEFRDFVMKHVDATLEMSDVNEINKRARTQCPSALHGVCNDLSKQADLALKEDSASP
jgi:hypothetical protein